jgi:ABC-type Zn uptake system ZnuABC Zn-binding protein ZnuA
MRGLSVLMLALLASAAQAAPLAVSATTTVIADIVRTVGGSRVTVSVMVPAGADAHTFQPTTGSIRSLTRSRQLFANGAGLEPWLPRLTAAAPAVPVTLLTRGLKLNTVQGAPDPHAWWDLRLAAGYARTVADTLTRLDPAGRTTYQHQLNSYEAQMTALDAYAARQFASLPAARRQLVTNHDSLNYLAARYGLTVVGAVFPGLGTEREPSARELAALVTAVRQSGARVIFTENTVNARLAQTLASETGSRVAPPLYTDALGPAGSAGDTLLRAYRATVDTIVKALR